jgi:hypothetical protein
MQPRSRRRPIAAASAFLLLVTGSSVPPPPTDTTPPARVLSRYETTAPRNTINRDCGYSTPLPGDPGRSLWLFCDSVWSGSHRGMWLGVTAAAGPFTPGRVPTALSELPSPPQRPADRSTGQPPQGLLPVPPGLILPGGTPCHLPGTAYSASWVSGVARQPGTDTLLLTYTDMCVNQQAITPQAFGLVQYRPSEGALGGQTRVFSALGGLPFQHSLGSPIFSGGFLHLFGSICDNVAFAVCRGGRVTLARVRADPAAWQNPAAYQYRTGDGRWSADAAQAQSVVPGAAPSAVVHVADYTALGKGLALIEQHGVNGRFQVWQAPSPTGPWRPGPSGTVPCGDQSGIDLCRAFIGHPELSTPRHLLMSYYNPADDHISVHTVPW